MYYEIPVHPMVLTYYFPLVLIQKYFEYYAGFKWL